MNCEQVRELLSAYLDNELALKEHQSVACHLHSCDECSLVLADYQRFDVLLSHLPRVEPQRSLDARIFSSTEYRELTGTSGSYAYGGFARHPGVSTRRLRDDPTRPKLVSIPGGRLARLSATHDVSPLPAIEHSRTPAAHIEDFVIAVCVLLLSGGGELVGRFLWQKQAWLSDSPQPLSQSRMGGRSVLWAGSRFVLLSTGLLLTWIARHLLTRFMRIF